MGKLLVRLFIKDYKNTKDPNVRRRYGKLAGIVGIISNLLLSAAKIITGTICGSIAIIADGINNLTDTSSSVITFIAFKLSELPADKRHPYGYARIEYLAGLCVSVTIIVAGVFLLYSSAVKIIEPAFIEFDNITIALLIAAVFVKLWQMAFYIYMGKRIDSITLIASAADSRNDVITTTVILIGIAITQFTGLQLDGYLGCAVALFILWSGIRLIIDTSSPLLGEAPSQELIKDIVDIVRSNKGVLGIHDLVVHNYGPRKIFASIHIEVDADTNILESHDMIDNIEKHVSQNLNIHFVAHMDPIKTSDPVVEVVRAVIEKTISRLDDVKSIHDLRIVPGPTHTNILFDVLITQQCSLNQEEIKAVIGEDLHKANQSYIAIISFDESYAEI
ncbi:MAG: cation diffusion facilitator family transporter [Leptospirales bacterium]|nr:cation diffusion facilitator family transporter [Leptospirales bacterium]